MGIAKAFPPRAVQTSPEREKRIENRPIIPSQSKVKAGKRRGNPFFFSSTSQFWAREFDWSGEFWYFSLPAWKSDSLSWQRGRDESPGWSMEIGLGDDILDSDDSPGITEWKMALSIEWDQTLIGHTIPYPRLTTPHSRNLHSRTLLLLAGFHSQLLDPWEESPIFHQVTRMLFI